MVTVWCIGPASNIQRWLKGHMLANEHLLGTLLWNMSSLKSQQFLTTNYLWRASEQRVIYLGHFDSEVSKYSIRRWSKVLISFACRSLSFRMCVLCIHVAVWFRTNRIFPKDSSAAALGVSSISSRHWPVAFRISSTYLIWLGSEFFIEQTDLW